MNKELRPDYFGFSVTCAVCGNTKNPLGRSAPIGTHYCDHECDGYYIEPMPSQLWPNESEADFGYPVSR